MTIFVTQQKEKRASQIGRLFISNSLVGGFENFVIFNFGGCYIQFCCNRGDYELHGEAVGNENLLIEDHLDEKQINQLLALGWNKPDAKISGGNFHMKWPVDSEAKRGLLVEHIYKTAQKVYGYSGISEDKIILNLE